MARMRRLNTRVATVTGAGQSATVVASTEFDRQRRRRALLSGRISRPGSRMSNRFAGGRSRVGMSTSGSLSAS